MKTPDRRFGLFAAGFGLILLATLVLAYSGATKSLSSGLSWLSIVLAIAGAALAVAALRASKRDLPPPVD